MKTIRLSIVVGLLISVGCLAKSREGTHWSASEKIGHLYNRLGYGMRPSDGNDWKGVTDATVDAKIKNWIDAQLTPEKVRDVGVDEELSAFPALKLSPTEARERYKPLDERAKEMGISDFKDNEEKKKELREKIGQTNLPDEIVREMIAQKIVRAVRSRRQLQEVLADFWMNHFNIDITKGEDRWLLPAFERNSIRAHLFGHFDEMLKATAHDPAMLFYLDNHLSRGPNKKKENGLNENYAREIMELHTLGVNGGYTQADVTELARILTGWGIADKKNPIFEFKEKIHDQGKKTFLGQDFSENGGQDEGERAILILANHPSTAHFISMELARYFVSDHPPESLVKKLTQKFIKTHGDLKQIYRLLFTSSEFWSHDALKSKVKKPSHFVFSAIRALGGDVDPKSELPKVLAAMGEDLYKCAPPTGYRDDAGAWVNPGAMVSRLDFALKLASNKIDGVFVQLPTVSAKVRNPVQFIAAISNKIMNSPLSESTQKVVLQEFDPDHHQMMDGEVRPFSLVKATGMILGSPEFQRK